MLIQIISELSRKKSNFMQFLFQLSTPLPKFYFPAVKHLMKILYFKLPLQLQASTELFEI